jgi:hypothetical protein
MQGKRLAIAFVIAVGIMGCGAEDPLVDPPAVDPPGTPAPVEEDDAEAVDDMDLVGVFSGEPDLEGGCAWVETRDGTRYEVLWPDGYEVSWEPLTLLGPDGEVVAESGDEVGLTGAVDEDAVSFCMIGPIFEATAVEAP